MTPSAGLVRLLLTAQDLRPCHFEPGSEGKIVHTLCDPAVMSYSIKRNWTVRSLLRDVATQSPPLHALLDVGALITGMTNREVAAYLLQAGLPTMQGCAYIDRSNKKMILLRADPSTAVPLAQAGVARHLRFSFYDQVHCTGMDIKQALQAKAAITLGKDMTLRDYSQGAWRMRGIGAGQTLQLLIPGSTLQLMKDLLAAAGMRTG